MTWNCIKGKYSTENSNDSSIKGKVYQLETIDTSAELLRKYNAWELVKLYCYQL